VFRTFVLYSAATVLALVAVPAAVVGWYEMSPQTFSSAVHATVDVFDEDQYATMVATGPDAGETRATAAAEPEEEAEPKTVLGQQLASAE
jgi:hypothetical protein